MQHDRVPTVPPVDVHRAAGPASPPPLSVPESAPASPPELLPEEPPLLLPEPPPELLADPLLEPELPPPELLPELPPESLPPELPPELGPELPLDEDAPPSELPLPPFEPQPAQMPAASVISVTKEPRKRRPDFMVERVRTGHASGYGSLARGGAPARSSAHLTDAMGPRHDDHTVAQGGRPS